MRIRTAKFAMIPLWIMQHDQVRGNSTRIVVYAGLQAAAWEAPDTEWRSTREMAAAVAEVVGVPAETCRKHLSALVRIGAIVKTETEVLLPADPPGLGHELGHQRPTPGSPATQNDDHTVPKERVDIDNAVGEPTATEPTVNQVAKKLVDDYWSHVKEQTGKHPVGITWKAMRSLVVPFLEAGYTVSELKAAMKAVRDNSRSFTRQVLEQHLDGRARRRVAASRAQVGADVDAQVRDEFEDAIAAGDAKLAWTMFVQKARARGETWFAEIAGYVDGGTPAHRIPQLVRHDNQPATTDDVAAVLHAKAEIDARCRAARGEPPLSPPMVEPTDRPALKGPA